MEKHYCEGIGMIKSIYHTFNNGKVGTRVVIRDRLSDNDLKDVIAEATRNIEAIREYHRQKALRKEAIKLFYKSGGGWRHKWWRSQWIGNDDNWRS